MSQIKFELLRCAAITFMYSERYHYNSFEIWNVALSTSHAALDPCAGVHSSVWTKYPLPDMRHYVSYPSFIHSSRWSRSNKTCWRQYVKTIRKYLISFIYKKVGRALPCRFPQKEVLYIFSLKRWITFNSIFICYLILSKCKDLSKLSTNALWCLDHLAKNFWKGILLFRSIK